MSFPMHPAGASDPAHHATPPPSVPARVRTAYGLQARPVAREAASSPSGAPASPEATRWEAGPRIDRPTAIYGRLGDRPALRAPVSDLVGRTLDLRG